MINSNYRVDRKILLHVAPIRGYNSAMLSTSQTASRTEMTILASYSDVVSYAMQNEKHASVWHEVLSAIKKRRDAESDLIKEYKTRRPGMPPSSVLDKYAGYLDRVAPYPSYPIVVKD